MEKPISLIIQETKSQIISAMNRSSLPASILELVIKEIHSELSIAAYQELQKSSQEYSENQNSDEKNGSDS